MWYDVVVGYGVMWCVMGCDVVWYGVMECGVMGWCSVMWCGV